MPESAESPARAEKHRIPPFSRIEKKPYPAACAEKGCIHHATMLKNAVPRRSAAPKITLSGRSTSGRTTAPKNTVFRHAAVLKKHLLPEKHRIAPFSRAETTSYTPRGPYRKKSPFITFRMSVTSKRVCFATSRPAVSSNWILRYVPKQPAACVSTRGMRSVPVVTRCLFSFRSAPFFFSDAFRPSDRFPISTLKIGQFRSPDDHPAFCQTCVLPDSRSFGLFPDFRHLPLSPDIIHRNKKLRRSSPAARRTIPEAVPLNRSRTYEINISLSIPA